jgi:hypothetical protein
MTTVSGRRGRVLLFWFNLVGLSPSVITALTSLRDGAAAEP